MTSNQTSQEVLTTQQLAIGYSGPRRARRIVADKINITLKSGELVCLLGPNGAGKSTLIRTIAGMRPPLAGKIYLLGTEINRLKPRELAKRLSVVLTDRVEVGMLSAYDLVALGRHPHTGWSGKLSSKDENVVQWAIEAVGANNLANRNVNELSDGERQKIMIARALAQEPGLIILDEPTAFLDLPRRVDIMNTLRRLARETGRAILLSTHDLDLALRSADKIWLLPPGGPLHIGAPEDLVLSGAFEATFLSEGVEFDPVSGAFQVSTNYKGQVGLEGQGLGAIWTKRALERAGFKVAENSPLLIEVSDDAANWRIHSPETVQEQNSVYDLVNYLQNGNAAKN